MLFFVIFAKTEQTMRKSSFLWLVISLIVFISCDKVEEEKEVIIAIDKTSYSLNSSTNSIPVSFVTNMDWSVSSSAAWCKVFPSSGTVNDNNHAEFTISVEANSTYDKRSCQVNVTAGKKTVTITIDQDCQYAIKVSKTQYSIESDAQSLSIPIEANVPFTAQPDKDWIQIVSTKSLESSTLTLSIKANESFTERSGNITIQSSDRSISSRISITQAPPKLLSNAANCYMVKPNSSVSFKAIKGNRSLSVGEVKSVWKFRRKVTPSVRFHTDPSVR